MADTAKSSVLRIAALLEEHRGEDVVVLSVGEMIAWTDFFVICTVRSAAHLKGLLRALSEHFVSAGVQPLRGSRKLPVREEGWVLVDCGDFVIHLMDREHRTFYELEKLWFRSEAIYPSKSS